MFPSFSYSFLYLASEAYNKIPLTLHLAIVNLSGGEWTNFFHDASKHIVRWPVRLLQTRFFLAFPRPWTVSTSYTPSKKFLADVNINLSVYPNTFHILHRNF